MAAAPGSDTRRSPIASAWRRASARVRRASLRQRLALLLLPALLGVTAVGLHMTRIDAVAAADSAYDRSLLGALRSIDANISIASGGLSVELPYTMFEFFELTASGQVHFRVATSDGLVELGSADLPLPPREARQGAAVFYDATYFGEAIRVAALRRVLDRSDGHRGSGGHGGGGDARTVLIQVGESTRSREAFTARFVRAAAVRDGVVLLVLFGATALALAAALRPLTRLALEVQARRSDDLTRIEVETLPADLRPLVAAVNRHMGDTQALLAQQRRFLDDASHQLRTHLTTLQMQIDYARRAPQSESVGDTLAAMGAEIGRITRSTQQLLALGRSDTVALEPVEIDLAGLLRGLAIELLPRARERHIDLGIQAGAATATAWGDEVLVREALANLVANAIAYTPPHGVVTLYASRDGGLCRLTVEDSGPGLSPAECAALGQRFRRGPRAGQGGAGLGVAIARSIAQRHRGGLDLRPRPDAPGLLAQLWWPADAAAPATSAAPAALEAIA
ncbi:MAG TPA: sensor histidine kinase N-terminal domain-containing protein [Variovorax sp.]|nr:sensor histidine kinase N-terminal domain-containing protein [Variovorax sp.]